MKLAALCCTYQRPHTLGQLIESFMRQQYSSESRELIILDDAGQYDSQVGDGWQLVSMPRRFHSLGEKRNSCAALASPDVDGFLVADDDDIYLPHWFETQAEALQLSEWSRPSLVLLEDGEGLREIETSGMYHGGWAFRKEAFYRVGGYGPLNNGEDRDLAERLGAGGLSPSDPSLLASPFYIYRTENNSYHLSHLSEAGYQDLGRTSVKRTTVHVGWFKNFATLPVKRHFTFAPNVNPDSDQTNVELIGSVDQPGKDGPTNGMFAFQREFRKRIDAGLDWLKIKPLPVTKDALPWFWNWNDRRYAIWWDSQGLPFVLGPNTLFTNSATPRIDADECRLLDAQHCRAMFCHSLWYRELISENRGLANESPIHMWPYPIDPWPGEPLPDEYDLLIYAKNGHRPQLLEHLAEAFPRHIQIHYGRYQREELFEAARRSRACAYLADDDHGPLALQEILLAGCPTVGVKTGASFVRDGETGIVVNRLPPGAKCLASEQDAADLATYTQAIEQAQALDRKEVRLLAAEQFDTSRIVDQVISLLDEIRKQVNEPKLITTS